MTMTYTTTMTYSTKSVFQFLLMFSIQLTAFSKKNWHVSGTFIYAKETKFKNLLSKNTRIRNYYFKNGRYSVNAKDLVFQVHSMFILTNQLVCACTVLTVNHVQSQTDYQNTRSAQHSAVTTKYHTNFSLSITKKLLSLA